MLAEPRRTWASEPPSLRRAAQHAREAKVDELELELRGVRDPVLRRPGKSDVFWLEVTVQHATRVDVLHALEHLLDDLQCARAHLT